MDGLFTEPEKLVLLWCPGLSGLVAEAAAGVPLGVVGCRRGAVGVPLDAAWVEEACGGFRCASIWDEFE